MGLYSLAFTLAIPFLVPDWIVKVGFGWCLGMAAFFSMFAFVFIVVLMIWGKQVRGMSWGGLESNEGGTRLIGREVEEGAGKV